MIEPHFLKPGSTIGIVATARKLTWEEVEPIIGVLADAGFKVRTGQRMFGAENQYSGSDEDRAADMQRMLDDETVNAILCARGGYGTVRIIDKLDFTEFEKHPKWLCGFSDITVLHAHINQNFGIATLHSSMPLSMKNLPENHVQITTLFNSLKGELPSYDFPSHPLNRIGEMEGEIMGGNLSVLYSILGSESDINTDGKILFLEDLDEYLYHIDRMMMNLKRNGKLAKLKGLIIGGMCDMKDNAVPFGKSAEEIIREVVEEYDYPVCFNFPAGHIDDNRALILGKKAAARTTDSGSQFQYVS
ncbi:MAG: LD-carboxypeptidase [Flavobacteriales bacterium]|jgi:muramoyltetrapeptide carboxypeptidase|nr:LD-carboxypeptidase [Flavobacteriales bacterium]